MTANKVNKYFVYLPSPKLVLCGHPDRETAEEHRQYAKKVWGEGLVLSRSDRRVKAYAKTHRAFAVREGFK